MTPSVAKVATVMLTRKVPSKVMNSPMNPEVPGRPTLARVNSMNTAA